MTFLPRHARRLAYASLALNAYAVLTPSTPGLPLFPHADKLVHVAIFLLPALLGVLGRLPVPAWTGVLVAYAVLSEVVQATLLSTRSGSVADLLADVVGIALGITAGAAIRRRRAVVIPDNGGHADLGLAHRPLAGRDARDR